jgi:integration host factor subunit alpha
MMNYENKEDAGAITKAKLADSLVTHLGCNRREALEIVDSTFEVIRESLSQGQEVRISGFGNFSLRDKAERPGRNPKTGEDVAISARRVVSFKAGQKLRKWVEKGANQ